MKDSFNTNSIDVRGYWQTIFPKVVPGSSLIFEGNAKAYTVEKVLGNKMLVSNYHFSKIENENDKSDFSKIRAEKFFIDRTDPNIKVSQLFLPKWAEYNYQDIKKILNSANTNNEVKNSYISNYSASDSPEIVNEIINLVSKQFGVTINTIYNEDLPKFVGLGVENSAAFVYEKGIYVNLDKASIEEPLHEVLHLVLGTMKVNDSDTYYRLINSVQYHPEYKNIAQNYQGNINSDILEEIFVKALSQTFRKNILKDGVYSSELFNSAIKKSVSDMLMLEKSLSWEDSFDLLGRSISDIMTEFASKLVGAEEGLINFTDAYSMFEVSGKVKKLIKNNQLIQECNG